MPGFVGSRRSQRLAALLTLVLLSLASVLFPLVRSVTISLEHAGPSLLPFFKKYGANTRRRLAHLGNKTLLHVAVESDNVRVLQYVLHQLEARLGAGRRLRAEVRVRDPGGRTPLHYVRSAAAAKLLLDVGASVVSCRFCCSVWIGRR